ncbi:MAG: hypothetical protein VX584_00855 [Actinomycetota bacterium]|nr:hypothetical protein [Actinomycetota bacterium]
MENWTVDDIRPMQGKKSKIQHTTKHLYSAAERWSDIIPELGNGYEKAMKQGRCTHANLKSNNHIKQPCEDHILQDHDEFYCPKYMEELRGAVEREHYVRVKPPKTSGKPTRKQDWRFAGPEGVLVLVREVGKSNTPEVKSAYRPELNSEEENPTPRTFYKEAVRKLNDKTSWFYGGSNG